MWKALKDTFRRKASNSKPSSENKSRFYPDDIAVHPDEPTRDQFVIVSREGFGEGVASQVFIAKGQPVFRFDGPLLDHQTLFTLQKKPGLYLEDRYFTGKILHSCDPNTTVDMEQQRFLACKDIHPGDFVTMDYESTEDVLFRSFHCQCGAERCRGLIAGKSAGTAR